MRKLVSLGLLALVLLTFSNKLLADGVGACNEMKQELQELKAYGLCIAWHNADENAKDSIAAKFFDRAGFEITKLGEPVFEQDFYCPCWDEVTFCDIEALGAPRVTLDVDGETIVAVTFVDFISFTAEGFGTDTVSCTHTIQDFSDPKNMSYLLYDDNDGNPLVHEEPLDCQSELDIMATMNFDVDCP